MVSVWLLDVDGVLNASRAGWSAAPRTGAVYYGDTRFVIRWSPELVARIAALHAAAAVEIRWATTWIPYHDRLSRLVGLPIFPAAWNPTAADVRHGDPTDVLYAKRDAALSVVAAGRRLVWTDDDAIPLSGPDRDVLVEAGALLIAPGPRGGLRPMHMDQIEGFCGEWTRSDQAR